MMLSKIISKVGPIIEKANPITGAISPIVGPTVAIVADGISGGNRTAIEAAVYISTSLGKKCLPPMTFVLGECTVGVTLISMGLLAKRPRLIGAGLMVMNDVLPS